MSKEELYQGSNTFFRETIHRRGLGFNPSVYSMFQLVPPGFFRFRFPLRGVAGGVVCDDAV